MSDSVVILSGTAAAIAVGHTVLGPDHYVPFVAMAKAGRWSLRRTVVITLLCGMGHVLSSAALGALGLAIGVGVLHLERIESLRGDVAGWMLLAFGILYTVWGLRRAARSHPHTHWHAHADGTVHQHEHVHASEHLHPHEAAVEPPGAPTPSLTPWILFTIFIFGPCEPLIPLVMYPAAKGDTLAVVWVTTIFSLLTIATMTVLVVLLRWGITFVHTEALERYTHAFAGVAIAACGVAVTVLGL